MAIATVVTRGYGNGTVSGDVNLAVTRGYISGAAAASISPPSDRLLVVRLGDRILTVQLGDRLLEIQ